MSNPRLCLVLFIVLAVGLSGCGGGGDDLIQYFGNLDGYVYVTTGGVRVLQVRGLLEDIETQTSQPLSGATVTISGKSGTTGIDGYFEITSIPVGTYTVSVSASGFQTFSISGVTISKDQTTHLSYQNMTLARKAWSFLVYLDGDNNLEPFAISDLNEMEQVGSTSQVNILVLIDRIPGYDISNGDWPGTRLYYVTKDTNTSTISSTLLADLGERDMSDPNTLRDFIIYCQEHFPADKTCLTLWNHGAGVWPKQNNIASAKKVGPKDVPTSERGGLKGICWDDTTGSGGWNCLTTDEVANALAAAQTPSGQKIDIINMDACLTQMLEVAYEWNSQIDFLVGSEASVPGSGNDYSTVLGHLTGNPNILPRDFAITLVDDFFAYYSTVGGDTTYSAISLDPEFNTFVASFAGFATALRNTANMSGVYNAWLPTSWFGDSDEQNDLYDFTSHIITLTTDANLANKGIILRNAFPSVIIHHHETGIYAASGTRPAYGLGILIPTYWEWSNYSGTGQYRSLKLCNDTDWDEFILRFVAYTTPTTLTINNQFTYSLDSMSWRGIFFGNIAPGYSVTRNVSPGSDYLYFKVIGYWFRTAALITVSLGQQETFTVTGNTLVYGPLGITKQKAREIELADAMDGIQ